MHKLPNNAKYVSSIHQSLYHNLCKQFDKRTGCEEWREHCTRSLALQANLPSDWVLENICSERFIY